MDFRKEHEVGDAKGTQAEHVKTAKQVRKKKRHREKDKGHRLDPAEDGYFEPERPRKRHKLGSSDASPGCSRSTTADSSSPVSSSPPVSRFPEEPTKSQSVLDLRSLTPTPPPSLQRFPFPSRPHAPERLSLPRKVLIVLLRTASRSLPIYTTLAGQRW
jgi:hypothetical protein